MRRATATDLRRGQNRSAGHVLMATGLPCFQGAVNYTRDTDYPEACFDGGGDSHFTRLRVTEWKFKARRCDNNAADGCDDYVIVPLFVGSQLVASDGIQRIHWGRVSGFWKTHKVPDPESRDATPQFNRPLARGIASHHRNAECRAQTRNLRNKFCTWKGISKPD